MNTIKPKYKIGQIVQMNDEYHFNPSSETISIGKVEAIHIHNKIGNSFLQPKYRITYSISGFSLMPGEEQLKLYQENEDENA